MVELIIKERNRKIKYEMTVYKTAEKILQIMRNHIGEEKGILKDELFARVTGLDPFDMSDLHYYVIWDIIRKGMHYCRRNTKCFITNSGKGEARNYFVVKSASDAEHYSTMVKNIQRKLNWMDKRAKEAVRKEWYKLEWVMKDARI